MLVAETLVLAALAWLLVGLAAGIPFVVWGAGRLDEAARGASLGFRLAILPGAVALWPVLLWRWRGAAAKGERP